jgi:hypothetical protein
MKPKLLLIIKLPEKTKIRLVGQANPVQLYDAEWPAKDGIRYGI